MSDFIVILEIRSVEL